MPPLWEQAENRPYQIRYCHCLTSELLSSVPEGGGRMLPVLSVSGSWKTLPKSTEPTHPIPELAYGFLDQVGGLALQGNGQRDSAVNRGWEFCIVFLASVRACELDVRYLFPGALPHSFPLVP